MEVPHGKIWVPAHAHPSIAGDPLLPVPTSRPSSLPWDKLRDRWVQSPRCSCPRGNTAKGAGPAPGIPPLSQGPDEPRGSTRTAAAPPCCRSSALRSPAPPSRPAGRRAGGPAPAEGGFLRGSAAAGRGVGAAGCAGGCRGCGVGAGVGAFFWGGGRVGRGGGERTGTVASASSSAAARAAGSRRQQLLLLLLRGGSPGRRDVGLWGRQDLRDLLRSRPGGRGVLRPEVGAGVPSPEPR